MIRILLAALITLATVSTAYAELRFVRPSPAFPKTINGTVTLHYMPGGVVREHMKWAWVWSTLKRKMIIADDQYSAAAMMVVAFKNNGGKACYRKGADLYFHLLSNGIHPGVLLSRADKKIIGPVTHRFKRISPAAFGIPRCK